MYKTGANNGQIKMAAQGYSDISGLLFIFITADRYSGGKPATSFGLKRCKPLKNE